MNNYLTSKGKESQASISFNDTHRRYGVSRIKYLHKEKSYKRESLFIAISIFDRYIDLIGYTNFDSEETITLATICVLLCAKLEQPVSPNFNRMINLLEDEEADIVSKEKLINLEMDILKKFAFDF